MKLGPFEFKLGRLFQAVCGNRILSGPFHGIRYEAGAVGSELGPKILGTYEKELVHIVERICKTDYDVMVNPGCAEGYYVVGLAVRMPNLKVVAYESQEEGRKLAEQNASLNGVRPRVTIGGHCSAGDLNQALEPCRKPLVLMDIEGGEMELCDPAAVPGLLKADILVELHDFVDPKCGDIVRSRFEGSHGIEEVWSEDRKPEDMPRCALSKLAPFTSHKGVRWIDERRNYKMRWFWMTVRKQTR